MANNVYSKIILQDANIEAEKAFVEVFNYLEDQGEKGLEYSHILPFCVFIYKNILKNINSYKYL